jgi:hypothetical protein
VVAEYQEVVPPPLVAVTCTRRYFPRYAEVTLSVGPLAPLILEQELEDEPLAVTTFLHWYQV